MTKDLTKWLAFTLAEVLITLTVIGVVAALTIPPFMIDYETRQFKTQSSNFERKLGEAIRLMNIQHNLQGYSTTKEFVEALSKYMKISKICTNITDCFVENIEKSDKQTIATSDLTTSSGLGHVEFGTETIGVQFNNGINALIAYNKNVKETFDDSAVRFTQTVEGKNKYIKLHTQAISILYDVTGFDKPNKNKKDILSVNSIIGGSGISGCVTDKSLGNYCIKILGTDYEPLNCRTGMNTDYCGTKPSQNATDYWAGAQKACEDEGLSLASKEDLHNIWTVGSGVDSFVPTTGYYWANEESTGTDTRTAQLVNMANGVINPYTGGKEYKWTNNNVICIE